jgi:putative redox protein
VGERSARADREGRAEVNEPQLVAVKWVGEHNFDAGRPGRPTARFDGDGRTGPSPVDGLLASLGTCTATDVVDILAKRRTPVQSLEIDVVAERVDTVPRRLKHVMLNFRIGGAGIERVHAERAVELAVTKYCSVRDSLRPDVPVEWTIELASEKV